LLTASPEPVIWDHLSAHMHIRARFWIEAAGTVVCFLPPYSPDSNPIELAFSKRKAYLRGVGARTRTDLDQAITEALPTISRADAIAWFAYCDSPDSGQLLSIRLVLQRHLAPRLGLLRHDEAEGGHDHEG